MSTDPLAWSKGITVLRPRNIFSFAFEATDEQHNSALEVMMSSPQCLDFHHAKARLKHELRRGGDIEAAVKRVVQAEIELFAFVKRTVKEVLGKDVD